MFAIKCAACHRPTGTEGPKDRLVGGQNTLATPKPIRTIGSYWPYATTLYDYINRAMPFNAPQSLTPDEMYSVIAWLLHQNGIVDKDAVIDAGTLPWSRCRETGTGLYQTRAQMCLVHNGCAERLRRAERIRHEKNSQWEEL